MVLNVSDVKSANGPIRAFVSERDTVTDRSETRNSRLLGHCKKTRNVRFIMMANAREIEM